VQQQAVSAYRTVTVPNPPLIIYLSLFFLLVYIQALGAKYCVFSFPLAPGVSSFYLVVAVMVAGAVWFGLWGVCAAYFGCVIGAGILSGFSPETALFWSVSDLIQVAVPYYVFKRFQADPGLITKKDVIVFILSGVLLNNLAGSLWGAWSLLVSGLISQNQFNVTFYGWFITNVLVSAVITPLLLLALTPWIRTHELYRGMRNQ
jgi:hypothetical protein